MKSGKLVKKYYKLVKISHKKSETIEKKVRKNGKLVRKSHKLEKKSDKKWQTSEKKVINLCKKAKN